ncbi:MAG: DUF3857 domain-containing protein [Burkholderiales bacterium]|nr:DUF3857 domain-containing protein [Burkholderiales bacterium]
MPLSRHSVAALVIGWTLIGMVGLPGSAAAETEASDESADFTRYERYSADYELHADGTHIETHSWALKVLADQGVEDANQTSISYSQRLQEARIIEAYTLKSDGRRIDAPERNFQISGDTGAADNDPVFSDIKTMTVVFPEVAAGDTVVFAYRLIQKEALFPGHFTLTHSFSPDDVLLDTRIGISAPESVGLRTYSRDVAGGIRTCADGRCRWEWTYSNVVRGRPERGMVSALDYGPLILASTFRDYLELGAAYESRARERSTVTTRVRSLADELTQDTYAPREQVRLFYDWVSRNIKFAGNCVGAGSVVPRDVDRVLETRMGDCKDHTALMQALMEAKGISSTPALVQSGNVYRLPDLPVLSAFNHVMNYVPSLDLYLDATATNTPFGRLPFGSTAKPVVLTTAPARIAHTPAIHSVDNRTTTRTDLRFAADGSAQGHTEIEASGMFASGIKNWFDYLQPRDEEEVVRRAIASTGGRGTGTLIRADTSKVVDQYRYGSRYTLQDAINLPGPGALYVSSPFPGAAAIARFASIVHERPRTRPFICMGGIATEIYTYRLPRNARLLAVPRPVHHVGKNISYRATYAQKGNTITATRTFEDRTPSGVCDPGVDAANREIAQIIQKDLRKQLVYR